jgi:hypothetical protein
MLGAHSGLVGRVAENKKPSSALAPFAGKTVVDAHGVRHTLVTDPAQIRRLVKGGLLDFETFYAWVG